jgi:tetratricopeptide (TPR) repeat protein
MNCRRIVFVVHLFFRKSVLLLAASLLLFAGGGCREVAEKEAVDKMSRAEEALAAEDWEKADEFYYEAILLDPDRADAWIGRGMTQTQLGELDEARGHYEQALALYEKKSQEDPLATNPLRGRILLLVLLDRSGEALSLANEAARGHPDRSFARELEDIVRRIEADFSEMILPSDPPPPSESQPETPPSP